MNKPTDESLDIDDFDVEDLEEDDVLPEDSWDEFEDETGVAGAGAENPERGQARSFVQKYFVFIVAGVVVVFGGLLLIGLTGGKKQPAPQTEIQADDTGAEQDIVELADEASMPPMPAPITTMPEENAQAPADAEALTPMPEEARLNEAALSDFDFSELPQVPGNVAPEDTQDKAALADRQDVASKDTPAAEKQISGDLESVMSKLETEEATPASEVATPAAPDNALTQKVMILEQEITGKDQKIEELQNSLAVLEKKIAALETEKAKLAAAQSKAKTPAPTRAAPAKVAAPKATAAPKEATNWVLRAAQPGRAIVAPQGSNDLRTVEIGNTLEGIGRVTAVEIESGRWVVRGTKGVLRQ